MNGSYDFKTQLATILSWDIMKTSLLNGQIPLFQLHTIMALMTRYGIGYDLSFAPATSREAAGLELTVYITPASKLLFEIDLGPGPTSFTK